MSIRNYGCLTLLLIGVIFSCKNKSKGMKVADLHRGEKRSETTFEQTSIIQNFNGSWAEEMRDITGDKRTDLLYFKNLQGKAEIGYYKAPSKDLQWLPVTIGTMVLGDSDEAIENIKSIDIDGDHDLDILVFSKIKSSNDTTFVSELQWYENVGEDQWKWHQTTTIFDTFLEGEFDFADLDDDGKIDFTVLLANTENLFIFKQEEDGKWNKIKELSNSHMNSDVAIGKVDDDNYLDIVISGQIYYNPGSDMSEPWKIEKLNEKWKNYDTNANHVTKTALTDMDFDGKVEVYMAHAELAGYPLVAFKNISGSWQYRIVKDSMPPVKRLEVLDFDKDVDFDLLVTVASVDTLSQQPSVTTTLMQNDGSYINYKEVVIKKTSDAMLHASDFDMDGDVDFLLLPNSKSTNFSILENTLN